MRESLSKRIKRYRKNSGLTQQQVGDVLGISRVAVSKWESGDTKDLKRANLIGISKLFGVSLNDLMGHHAESTEVDMVDHITLGGPRALPIISYVQAGSACSTRIFCCVASTLVPDRFPDRFRIPFSECFLIRFRNAFTGKTECFRFWNASVSGMLFVP